ncbi:hypothetical protein PF049_00115 [Erythrobacteraceae bacterium WH01K]|nr:hypothetical protein PF049_00115 [Erythrobacteraceae bacterium WH01K]
MQTVEDILEQFSAHADTDPQHWNTKSGNIPFGDTNVEYQRFDDHFIVTVRGEQYTLKR